MCLAQGAPMLTIQLSRSIQTTRSNSIFVLAPLQTIPRNTAPFFAVLYVIFFGSSCVLTMTYAAETLPHQRLVQRYCLDCHNTATTEGGLNLETVLPDSVAQHSDTWERVIRKLSTHQMPPVGSDRPSAAAYNSALDYLTTTLDSAEVEAPNPGFVPSFRRLNRTEYENAIRDLLDLEIDATELLPPDESSDGFDHTRMRHLPATLISRYVTAARRISQLAVGLPLSAPGGRTYRIRPDVTQEKHMLGLPLGTRGGGSFLHHFRQSGTYEVQIRLTRDRNDEVEGLTGKHELVILVDKESLAHVVVEPPPSGTLADFDDGLLTTRIHVASGPHRVGATFLRKTGSLAETVRQPLNVHFNLHRHPRLSPAIYELSITGPFPPHSESRKHTHELQTPSQRRIFVARPSDELSPRAAATLVLRPLARRAYRRTVTNEDLDRLLRFFEIENTKSGFDSGIQASVAAILTSPHFLFKMEAEPATANPNMAYAINDFELASRLSFFLWSSVPDIELLDLAEQGVLSRPEVLADQVQRMFTDSRTNNLATNFASQWLQLRNLDAITPDARKFPDFDDNLRQAMRRETELHFEQLINEDRSVLELLQTQHTYLNERLAHHYEIKGVSGSRYRRVDLASNDRRGGILRQASILTITSYATRTSPVVRGNWVLENILGAAAPPPPDEVPTLDEQSSVGASSSIRDRLMQHRQDPACASCHDLMDPIGFAMENYDAVGRWRELDQDTPILTKGKMPNGKQFDDIAGLETALLEQPELFVTAFVEKLLTFALGRAIELHDAPAIRKIVRDAHQDNFSLSAIIQGIVRSVPFQLRISQ
ncbi:MAG TPA: hypothetical protein DEF45_20060 [Rhodopirellula sp.]|nr:hypothetical protein [Rhodopirellula sp.]